MCTEPLLPCGVCLCVQDFENACSAYEQAIKLEGSSGDYLTHLNYALTLYLNDETEKAATHFHIHTQLFELVRRTHTQRRKTDRQGGTGYR